jgi:DNA-binding XRE family transcriptional regulator
MSDLKAYISRRRANDEDFDAGFDEGYKAFKIGTLLKRAREKSGLTQAEMARLLHTQKSAISRIENHAEDIRLSTLEKYVSALGLSLEVSIR